jgi:hypothetical protein
MHGCGSIRVRNHSGYGVETSRVAVNGMNHPRFAGTRALGFRSTRKNNATNRLSTDAHLGSGTVVTVT